MEDTSGAVRRWTVDLGQKCFPCCVFAKSGSGKLILRTAVAFLL